MKILIALNHPAHYYLFKFMAKILLNKSHEIIFVIKDKDILEKLLINESVPYIKISEKKDANSKFSIVTKGGSELLFRDLNLLKIVNKTRPDIMLGTDIAITHIGKIKKIPSIVFNEDDYEINKFFCKLSYPFATHIISPEYCSVGKYNYKKIGYNGIQKMAYLNKKYFVPDFKILESYNIRQNEKFFIIRLVSLTAGHDIEGVHKGLNENILLRLIHILEPFGKVFITSEIGLSAKFNKYHLDIPVNKIHHFMAYASLFIGDSQTMCAEAGILGTPFIRYNDFVGKISYLNDLENNYNLGYGIKTNEINKLFNIVEKLKTNIVKIKKDWIVKSNKLFFDKIDVTAFMVWFIENYPQSVKIMRENPEFQYKFR